MGGRRSGRRKAIAEVKKVAAAGAKVEGIVADFAGAEGADAVTHKLGAVDILVNNVGSFEPKPFAEIPDADWYRLFEVNVMSGGGFRARTCREW